jgi:hypothetical protein
MKFFAVVVLTQFPSVHVEERIGGKSMLLHDYGREGFYLRPREFY